MTSYHSWDEVQRELLTDRQIAESEQRAQRLLAQVYAYRLAEIRKRRGLTQTEVAHRMGVSQRRVSAIEHGAERATRTTLAAYAAALGGRLRLVAEFEDESLALG
ncbi:MAG: helix-turn-helix transcriptional regulator [Streptosporangiaceae bacterium]